MLILSTKLIENERIDGFRDFFILLFDIIYLHYKIIRFTISTKFDAVNFIKESLNLIYIGII